jgi:hypothetical protein
MSSLSPNLAAYCSKYSSTWEWCRYGGQCLGIGKSLNAIRSFDVSMWSEA